MTRAAASSMARGSPSRRRQIAATAAAFSSVSAKSGTTACGPLTKRRDRRHAGELSQRQRCVGRRQGQRRHRELALGAQLQRLPAGGQDRQAAGSAISSVATAGARRRGPARSCRGPGAAASIARNAAMAGQQRLSPWLAHPEDTGDRRQDQRRIGERGEIDEPDAVGEGVERSAATARASRVLPVPPGPVRVTSRSPSRSIIAENGRPPLRGRPGAWAASADWFRAARVFASGGKLDSESRGEHLPDAFRFQQIAQPVLAEIEQGHRRGQGVLDQRCAPRRRGRSGRHARPRAAGSSG